MAFNDDKYLLVVGNGLDKGLGYPTSYSDFGKYVIKKYNNSNGLLSSNISYVCGMYTSFNHFAKTKNMSLWKDFENNLPDVNNPSDPGIKFQSVSGFYDNLPRALTCVFSSWTKSIDSKTRSNNPVIGLEYHLIKKLVDNASSILTFNYTKTLETHFNINPSIILHIHGTSKHPIFGHGSDNYHCRKLMKAIDEYDKNRGIMEQQYGNPYREELSFWDSTEKPTKDVYTNIKNNNYNWLKSLRNIKKIIFFGISYSKIDEVYYKYMADGDFLPSDCKLEFYYLPDKNKSESNEQQEQNNYIKINNIKRFAKYLNDKNIESNNLNDKDKNKKTKAEKDIKQIPY